MQFNSGSSTIQPQAGVPTHTCGRNAHQNTFIPYTNQNGFLDFPPDYTTVISANTIAGDVAENTQNRSNANELQPSVPYNLAIHPQHLGQVVLRGTQMSAEYQGAQVPSAYPVVSNPHMNGVGVLQHSRSEGSPMPNSNPHSQYPPHSTVVHQGPSIISGITIGQILAFNHNTGHSTIPSTNSNLRNIPPHQENNALRLSDNARASTLSLGPHLPNVSRGISSQNENKPVGTGADLSVFNPKTPNILRAQPYRGRNSIQYRQNAGMPMQHSNYQNISQKPAYQTDHCSSVHNIHNTRPLANANRQDLSQAPYHPENIVSQQQLQQQKRNSGDRAALSAANFSPQGVPRVSTAQFGRACPDPQKSPKSKERLSVPLIEPVQEYFDDPDAEGSTDDEYYESIDMSSEPQSDLTGRPDSQSALPSQMPQAARQKAVHEFCSQVNASHDSPNVRQRPSERKSETVRYLEKRYGIQLQLEDYELLNQGQNPTSKSKNNVDLHGDKPPSITRDHQAPFAQGISKDDGEKQGRSSCKRQREEEVGTAPTARPTRRLRSASPASSSAQPASSNPLPSAAPIEPDTSFYDEKCPEEAFFVRSFDGSRCRYRHIRTGKLCTKVITNHKTRGRYRHLATHAQKEQDLINKGRLREEDAVLLTRLPKTVVACKVKGCAWRGQVWRTDNVRKTHEKESHPELYAKRLEMKEKRKQKQKQKNASVVEEFEESESESSEPDS